MPGRIAACINLQYLQFAFRRIYSCAGAHTPCKTFMIAAWEINSTEADELQEHEMKRTTNNIQYFLVLDYVVIDKTANFIEAIEIPMASYFTFNRIYPQNAGCFLQFLQMKYLKIYTELSIAKNKPWLDTVNSFIRKINRF